jgi:hypothetical protein
MNGNVLTNECNEALKFPVEKKQLKIYSYSGGENT